MSGAKPDEQIRTPMQWSSEEGAGFTSGVPWEAINADYQDVNVQKQTGDNTSLLEHYRKLIGLRNEHSALQVGKTFVAKSDSSKLLSYLRADDKEAVLVIINLDDKPVTNYDIQPGCRASLRKLHCHIPDGCIHLQSSAGECQRWIR